METSQVFRKKIESQFGNSQTFDNLLHIMLTLVERAIRKLLDRKNVGRKCVCFYKNRRRYGSRRIAKELRIGRFEVR